MKRVLVLIILSLWCYSLSAEIFDPTGSDDIIFFSDSPDGDKLYDSSWGYKKSPSELERVGEKFPVDTVHPYQGAHSLRLHWTSRSGGDWGMAVASVGWRGHNLTEYDSLTWYVNAVAAVTPENLPDIGVEDLSNKKSTRVALSDYISGIDADTSTWQKVSIPISDISPGSQNCDFTKIKTIFHFQKAADGIEHILWLDEIRAVKAGSVGPEIPDQPQNIQVTGHESRIDIHWTPVITQDEISYYVYRSASEGGPYEKVNAVAHETHIYSDFLGENERTYFYYVIAVNKDNLESVPSDTLSGTSYAMSDDELLTSVQEATFRYFYDYGHPVSGLTRERKGSGDVCTSGGTGFGLMALIVGAERNFVPRDSVVTRTLKILRFLDEETDKHHGAFSHWINGDSGVTVPFSQFDDGGDIVETAYLVEGLLCARQYFNGANATESEIRSLATKLWENIEWDWYRRTENGSKIYWHWSPNTGWQMNMVVQGWNEAMIVYLLAIASPTQNVPPSLYYSGWCGPSNYANGNSYYGYKQWVGWPNGGGPLFFTHYTFVGFDPRDKQDAYCNYFENNRNCSLINRAHCIDNPGNYAGYDSLVWGLTASDDPFGYSAHEPNNDNGTITPTAALSAMPYTPEESMATLKHFYHQYGDRLWGEFGFRDAFNLEQDWFAQSYLAIDQGPIILMIENYRTQLLWNLFMANPEIQKMLDEIGWEGTAVEDQKQGKVLSPKLMQNYPNPFNSQTIIKFELNSKSAVRLALYNVLGEKIMELLDEPEMAPGIHQVQVDAKDLSSGVYFYRLDNGGVAGETHKMLLIQ